MFSLIHIIRIDMSSLYATCSFHRGISSHSESIYYRLSIDSTGVPSGCLEAFSSTELPCIHIAMGAIPQLLKGDIDGDDAYDVCNYRV